MIHATAIVDPSAEVDASVEVGAYTVIGAGVKVAAGCRIGSHCVINGPTEIGRDNRIFQFSSIGEDPQDKKYSGETTALTIGNGNTIREFCTINRGTAQDLGETRIGDDNWIMAYVHIAHDCVVGDHTIFSNGAALAGHVWVGDWVVMAGNAGVHQFCRVGAHAFIGMYTAVAKDVPAYVTVMGQPATPRGINAEGLRRRGFSTEQIRDIREAYRVLYRSGLRLEEATERLVETAREQPVLQLMVDSLRGGSRSVLR